MANAKDNKQGGMDTMKYSLLDGSETERRVLLEEKPPTHSREGERMAIHRRNQIRTALFLVFAAVGCWTLNFWQDMATVRQRRHYGVSGDHMPKCKSPPCFMPAEIQVPANRAGFPSFLRYAHRGPLQVDYDSRAITLNGDRVFFLGGSMHPTRATNMTWNLALDEAVRNGLNLITIYVMWSAHQQSPTIDLDWGYPGNYRVDCDASESDDNTCGWNLASAIRAAANRGLFVHIRIGPYDCAEYSYGGIPEWLTLHKPNMVMRRPNKEWLAVMESFVTKIVTYITENQLWAHQGGNIILAQIENELGASGMVDEGGQMLMVDSTGSLVPPEAFGRTPGHLRNATIQDYADWCGALAERLAPNVTWTMCNGLYANNTILTCNAISGGSNWLENYGGNGRIQVDQPAIFTEFEAGFQTWGSLAEKPLSYFWGRTARAMARDAMKWFARGGTHLNYYMFWGGYNRGRAAGAGITNMYASDAALCSSGHRRQPKFGHFDDLHRTIAAVASVLLYSETAVNKGKQVKHRSKQGDWVIGDDQRLFVYETKEGGRVAFLENDADEDVLVEVPLIGGADDSLKVPMLAQSVKLLVNNTVEFDSASIDPKYLSMEREYAQSGSVPVLLDWSSWPEPIGAHIDDPNTWTKRAPVEQTELNVESGVYSDYAWYETSFTLDKPTLDSKLFVGTQKANAFAVLVDGKFVGSEDNHFHMEGPITLTVDIGYLSDGEHTLSLLSESLGYHNLIGRWGGSSRKQKGITGDVVLSYGKHPTNVSLVDGRKWKSYPGLHETVPAKGLLRYPDDVQSKSQPATATPLWSSALFGTPKYDPSYQGLFLKLTKGRGHIWLNGRDLGKFWNITRGDTDQLSQDHYHFPRDFLHSDGQLNELVIFNAFGDVQDAAELVLSWVSHSGSNQFQDEVDYKEACL